MARHCPGARVPLKMCLCSIWGSRGSESFCPLSERGFLSSWEGGTSGVRGALCPDTPATLRPVRCSLQGLLPWVYVALSFPFGDGK